MTTLISKTIVTEDDFTDAHDVMLDYTRNEDEILLERWDAARREWTRETPFGTKYAHIHSDESKKLQTVLDAHGDVKFRLVYEKPEEKTTATPSENTTKIIAMFEEHELRAALDIMIAMRELSEKISKNTPNASELIDVTTVECAIKGETLPWTIEPSEIDAHGYTFILREQN